LRTAALIQAVIIKAVCFATCATKNSTHKRNKRVIRQPTSGVRNLVIAILISVRIAWVVITNILSRNGILFLLLQTILLTDNVVNAKNLSNSWNEMDTIDAECSAFINYAGDALIVMKLHCV
jgi:hypothetical protein